jgi:hypothetical protein
MKDVKMNAPFDITSIGVFYEGPAKNVCDAFWPMILSALRKKNGNVARDKIMGPFALDRCRSVDDMMNQIRRRSSSGPLACYVFFLSGDKFYAGLKERLTGEKRIVTQFVQAQKQRPNLGNMGSMSIITHNIALQILCKLGACPW